MLLKAEQSSLLVVDVQEKLAPAVADSEAVVSRIALLLTAAERLSVPVTLSEHYPKGIGRTLPSLAALAPPDSILEKITFACGATESFRQRFDALGRRQVVVCGMETHVCVLQSALALLEQGSDVFLVEDAVASRRHSDRDAAIARLRAAGGTIVTAEMVVFEWLARADDPAFRELLALIK